MPHKLVHPNNRPSIEIREGSDLEVSILNVRKWLNRLLGSGALNVLANYTLQSLNNVDDNRVILSRLMGALMDENPINRIFINTDPFDKQNILTLALSDYEFPDEYVMQISPVNKRKSDPSESPTYRIRRSTPCPKDFINPSQDLKERL